MQQASNLSTGPSSCPSVHHCSSTRYLTPLAPAPATQHPSFVLLLSSKAGGVGLNIVGANRLVLFDPGMGSQYLARCVLCAVCCVLCAVCCVPCNVLVAGPYVFWPDTPSDLRHLTIPCPSLFPLYALYPSQTGILLMTFRPWHGCENTACTMASPDIPIHQLLNSKQDLNAVIVSNSTGPSK